MYQKARRLISFLLCISLVMSLITTTTYAVESDVDVTQAEPEAAVSESGFADTNTAFRQDIMENDTDGNDILSSDTRETVTDIDATRTEPEVAINETNFPDSIFREHVKTYDANNDGVLSAEERKAVVSIDLSRKKITSLQGIGFFTSLTSLDCAGNQLMILDVSGCSSLQSLNVAGNSLTSLDVSGCSSLQSFRCGNNRLESLDVSGCTSLQTLDCWGNRLTDLRLSGCNSLRELNCSGNALPVLDIAGLQSLQSLYCNNNKLTSLNISGHTSLLNLQCTDNDITSLDVSGCTSLQSLHCANDFLTNLNVSGCTALQNLECTTSLLASLDVSECISLQFLNVESSSLTSLDVSGHQSLQALSCEGSFLASLNVSGCTSLTSLDCFNSPLESLNISGCTSLQSLRCHRSKLASLDVSGYQSLQELFYSGSVLTSLNASDCPALQSLACTYSPLTSLDVSGCAALQSLDLSNSALTSLTVSDCAALKSLNCFNNELTQLDVGECRSLQSLNCSGNKLTSLDVSKLTLLTELDCMVNQLTDLDVTENTALISLICGYNQLTELDISGNLSLEALWCEYNQLTNLDVTGNKNLTQLICRGNGLTALDITKNSLLQSLNCRDNHLTNFDIGGNAQMSTAELSDNIYYIKPDFNRQFDLSTLPGSFDIARCRDWQGGSVFGTVLTVDENTETITYEYDCGNTITARFMLVCSLEDGGQDSVPIDEYRFPDENFRKYVKTKDLNGDGVLSQTERIVVKNMDVSYMQMSSLEGLEYFTALETLSCEYNRLISLDLSGNPKLVSLRCNLNPIVELDLAANSLLTELDCSRTSLTNLNLSENVSLTEFFGEGVYIIIPDENGQFDLSTLPGNFDANKVAGWYGGSVADNILTINEGMTYVECGYDTGYGILQVTLVLTTDQNLTGRSGRLYDAGGHYRIFRAPKHYLLAGAYAPHTPGEPAYENEAPATCGAEGSREIVICCADCGYEMSRQTETVAPAAGDHSFENGSCSVCGRAELRVTRQPADYYGLTGDDATFTAEANDAEAEYRWYYSNDGGEAWSPSGAEGHDTSSLTIRMISNRIGQLYRCVITTPGQRVETEAACLCLRETEPLAITRQPENFEGPKNAEVMFLVEATGEGLRYRWQYSNDGGIGWADSSADGHDTSKLRTVLKKYRDGQCFRCVISDVAGNTLTTNTVSMRISTSVVKITLQPQNCTVPAGGKATFTVKAEGEGLTHRWQYSNDGGSNWSDSGMTGARTSSLSVTARPYRNGQMYRCVIRDAYGTEAVTEAATLHVGGEEYAPVITAQPADYTGAANGTAVFEVTAQGENLTYQWQYSNDGGEKWSPSGLDGAKTSSLSVAAKPYRNGQMYRCIVTNGYGSVVSEAAAIRIDG